MVFDMVELPVSDNPKCEELVVTYGRWSLTSIELQEVFYLEKSEHIYVLETMYCMQFLGTNL